MLSDTFSSHAASNRRLLAVVVFIRTFASACTLGDRTPSHRITRQTHIRTIGGVQFACPFKILTKRPAIGFAEDAFKNF